jgi:hypothetical protein
MGRIVYTDRRNGRGRHAIGGAILFIGVGFVIWCRTEIVQSVLRLFAAMAVAVDLLLMQPLGGDSGQNDENPVRFTGKIKRVAIELGPRNLSSETRPNCTSCGTQTRRKYAMY